ncbi:MAG: hypothetical protein KKB31_03780 [Nanoarchaeota archaeon]|nr:hypothetical protein [Nanoarchaeota archaeon]
MELESSVKCVHQVFRPKEEVYMPPFMRGEGVGDCSVCSHDPNNNGKCKMYSPVRIFYLEIDPKP